MSSGFQPFFFINAHRFQVYSQLLYFFKERKRASFLKLVLSPFKNSYQLINLGRILYIKGRFKFDLEPLFDFITFFKNYLKQPKQNSWTISICFYFSILTMVRGCWNFTFSWVSPRFTYYFNGSSFKFIFSKNLSIYWPY